MWSLERRLVVASCCLLPMAMLLAWLALTQSHMRHLEQAQEARLQLQAYVLLGSLSVEDSEVSLQLPLAENRYNYIGSGLYGRIEFVDGAEIWRSPSSHLFVKSQFSKLFEQEASSLAQAPIASSPVEQLEHLLEDNVFRYRFAMNWSVGGQLYPVVATVIEVDDFFLEDYMAFKQALTFWLSAILVFALLAQVVILRWGLSPMRAIVKDIQSIKNGEKSELEGAYPKEISPLAKSLNTLIESEQTQRERYRNTLGDLAHSLKTPLAVILGADTQTDDYANYKQIVRAQAQRMDQIVQYQLGRAVKAKPVIQQQGCHVLPVVERICGALEKVYRHEEVEVQWQLASESCCAMDERDLMELLGNVLENAFKYSASRVKVTELHEQRRLFILIEDDGPGVSAQRREQIMQRGERLDTSRQGQGIGLTVASDIIQSYGGHILVDQSPELKGALFKLELPKV